MFTRFYLAALALGMLAFMFFGVTVRSIGNISVGRWLIGF